MYANYGKEAQKVLLQLPNKDAASCNVVIVGYANQEKVMKCSFALH